MRLLAAATVVALLLAPGAAPAHADHEHGHTTVTNGPTTFDSQNTQNVDGEQNPESSTPGGPSVPATPLASGPQPEVDYVPICLHGDPALQGSGFGCPSGEQVACGDGGLLFTMHVTLPGQTSSQSSTQCVEPGDPEDPVPTPTAPPVNIPGEALAAFKKVQLPESAITVQPPGGETLINFKTILSTQAEPHQVSVHLDKVNIDLVLDVWPSHFVWHHGDGTVQESTSSGRAWSLEVDGAVDVDSADFITHTYTSTLKAAPVSVDTTWSAQFKVVGDAGWRPVNGTVTKVGAAVPLTVREATPELVTEPN